MSITQTRNSFLNHLALVVVSPQDEADVAGAAAYLRAIQPQLNRLPAILSTIQATWPGQVVSNPLGTLQDVTAALNTPLGHAAAEADFLDGLVSRLRTTQEVHQDLVNQLNGAAPILRIMAPIVATAADAARLQAEAAYLNAASLAVGALPLAISAIQGAWTPPAGDGSIAALQAIASTLLPVPTVLKDMADRLRNVSGHILSSITTDQALQVQIANRNAGNTDTGTVIAPPLTRPAPAPAPANNNVWWLLGGIAVAGIGVYAITRPAAGLARKNPVTFTYRVRVQGESWQPETKSHGHAVNQARKLAKVFPHRKIEIWEFTTDTYGNIRPSKKIGEILPN